MRAAVASTRLRTFAPRFDRPIDERVRLEMPGRMAAEVIGFPKAPKHADALVTPIVVVVFVVAHGRNLIT